MQTDVPHCFLRACHESESHAKAPTNQFPQAEGSCDAAFFAFQCRTFARSLGIVSYLRTSLGWYDYTFLSLEKFGRSLQLILIFTFCTDSYGRGLQSDEPVPSSTCIRATCGFIPGEELMSTCLLYAFNCNPTAEGFSTNLSKNAPINGNRCQISLGKILHWNPGGGRPGRQFFQCTNFLPLASLRQLD